MLLSSEMLFLGSSFRTQLKSLLLGATFPGPSRGDFFPPSPLVILLTTQVPQTLTCSMPTSQLPPSVEGVSIPSLKSQACHRPASPQGQV